MKAPENTTLSANETIRRIREKQKSLQEPVNTGIYGRKNADTSPDLASTSRKRVSKSAKPVSTQARQSLMNAIIRKLLLAEITQGKALKTLRAEVLGLKQDAYADLVSVSRKTLSEVENDRGNYTAEVINKLFKPFGLQVGLVPTSRHRLAAILAEGNAR